MHPHLESLAKDVFCVETIWPHYRLLLQDMQELHNKYQEAHVLSLERSIQGKCGKTGGPSRWAPLFDDLTVVDHGLYDDRLYYSLADDIMDEGRWDLIINPNLLHHVRDQTGLFDAMVGLMEPSTELYIFDTPFRELHECPGDYVRYTPYGIKDALERAGITDLTIKEVCNSLEAIHYCLEFAKQSGELLDPPGSTDLIGNVSKWICEQAIKADSISPSDSMDRRMCMAWSVRGRSLATKDRA